MDDEQLTDLRQRIGNALAGLDAMAQENARKGERPGEHIRLRGKMEGLRLALDYLRAYEPADR